jgi:hypothetical protein
MVASLPITAGRNRFSLNRRDFLSGSQAAGYALHKGGIFLYIKQQRPDWLFMRR